MKRDATQTIWRTVVFAGAMLGAPACSKKKADTTPVNNAAPATTEPQAAPSTDNATPDPGAADPCAGMRERGAVDPCEGGEGGARGRGFVLS